MTLGFRMASPGRAADGRAGRGWCSAGGRGPIRCGSGQHEERGQGEVVDARGGQGLEVAEVGGGGLVGDEEEFSHADDGDQGGELQHADELVADRRDDDAQRLGEDDEAHGLHLREAEGVGGVALAGSDGADAGAHDFRHVGALVEAEGEDGAGVAGEDDAEGGQDVEGEDDLQQDGGAAEEPEIGFDEGAQRGEAGFLGDGEHESDDDAEG